MQRLQAFKYELMPTGEQQRQMRRFAGSCRFVFNKALALQKENATRQARRSSAMPGCASNSPSGATQCRNGLAADAPVHPLQQTLKDLEKAYKNFFAKRADFPRFKKKGSRTASAIPTRNRSSSIRPTAASSCPSWAGCATATAGKCWATVKNVTVSLSWRQVVRQHPDRARVEQPVPQRRCDRHRHGHCPLRHTLGRHVLRAAQQLQAARGNALRKVQQAMSRKTKFSNNWKKAKARVQKIHSRIGNARRDYLHKTTTTISQNHAMVCIEDLQVRNMSKSAAGSTEQPGKNVRAKSGLNKAILDQGWFEFRRQLDYKLAWNGGHLIAVPPQNTSRTCPACGHVSADNRQTQARFECVECGFEETPM
jgi:putative transposase